jgi:hypothetical protein
MQQTKQVQQPAQTYDDGDYDGQGTYGEEEKEFLKQQLDVNSTLLEFEHKVLRGQYLKIDDTTGEKKWVLFDVNAIPIINEIGIREVMGRMLGYANVITKMSYFEDEEVYKNMFYFDMSITETFAKRCDVWELDAEVAKAIKDACVELIQSVLFSARDGFTAISMRTQYSRQDISRNDSASQQSKRTFLGIPVGK